MVARSGLRPGDLVFFDDVAHVGLYIGHNRFIHAPHSGSRVSVAPLSGWYAGRFAGARRLIAESPRLRLARAPREVQRHECGAEQCAAGHDRPLAVAALRRPSLERNCGRPGRGARPAYGAPPTAATFGETFIGRIASSARKSLIAPSPLGAPEGSGTGGGTDETWPMRVQAARYRVGSTAPS